MLLLSSWSHQLLFIGPSSLNLSFSQFCCKTFSFHLSPPKKKVFFPIGWRRRRCSWRVEWKSFFEAINLVRVVVKPKLRLCPSSPFVKKRGSPWGWPWKFRKTNPTYLPSYCTHRTYCTYILYPPYLLTYLPYLHTVPTLPTYLHTVPTYRSVWPL